MMFSNLVSAMRRVARRDDNRTTCGLLSVRQLRQVLARERSRSDRSGDRFCLLAFSPTSQASTDVLHARLAEVLRARVRTTDETGWLDPVRIGVVMPATPPRGAWRLAEDV